MVPANMARTPSLAKSLRRSGTSAPMPPICIPMEPRLAKPHNAKVAMVKERGASTAPVSYTHLHRRLDFEAKVFAAGQRPEKIGLQPWETDEVWERLKSSMREYRKLSAAKLDTRPVEQVIIFYAGWLGHYVGDGSQPLHVTIQFNGWVGPNPNGYNTGHQIHWQFEGPFVEANMHEADVRATMTPVKAIDGDMFDAYVAYLRNTKTYVEKVYQLDKVGGFIGAGTPESRQFTAERLGAGASMLRDMIYTAWLESAKPVPDPYAQK